jgi:hypothetical protein
MLFPVKSDANAVILPSCFPDVPNEGGRLTADVSTEGVDRKFSVLGCFQRIPYISVSSPPIHIKTG